MSEEISNSSEVSNEKPKVSKEDNLRIQREYYERQLQQAKAEKEALEKQIEASKSGSYEEDEENEPYVDHKRLNKTLSSFEQRMEKKIDEKAEMKARQLIAKREEEHFVKDNNDFNKLMSNEYLEKFANKHPKIAENILRMPDNFERQKLVYETMKELGIDKDPSKEPSIQDKIDQNRRSPYYQPSGISNSPYQAQGDFSESGMKNAYAKLKELQKNLRL